MKPFCLMIRAEITFCIQEAWSKREKLNLMVFLCGHSKVVNVVPSVALVKALPKTKRSHQRWRSSKESAAKMTLMILTAIVSWLLIFQMKILLLPTYKKFTKVLWLFYWYLCFLTQRFSPASYKVILHEEAAPAVPGDRPPTPFVFELSQDSESDNSSSIGYYLFNRGRWSTHINSNFSK